MQASDRENDVATGPKLWVVLARAYGSLASYVEACVAHEGLCLSDFMVLEVLLHKGRMTISEIGEKVLLANGSMTSAVDRLERKALVSRRSSETDRRARIIELTAPGRVFIEDLYARHAKDLEAVTDVLSDREQHQLRTLLKKLGRSAQSATDRRVALAQGK